MKLELNYYINKYVEIQKDRCRFHRRYSEHPKRASKISHIYVTTFTGFLFENSKHFHFIYLNEREYCRFSRSGSSADYRGIKRPKKDDMISINVLK